MVEKATHEEIAADGPRRDYYSGDKPLYIAAVGQQNRFIVTD